MQRHVLIIVVAAVSGMLVCFPAALRAQLPQPQYVIDKPTAGMLPDKSYLLRGRAGSESSFLFEGMVGFREVVQFGLSYGVQNVLENGNPAINDYPGFLARIRLVGESQRMPALALGFDSQGIGVYHEALERYDRKSTGLYAVASKNFALILGQLSLHGGVSWSTERKDDDDPTIFAAMDWTLFDRLAFLLDVDTALNDNEETSFGNGGVYVDAGVGWYFAEYLNVMLAFRDLTKNFAPKPGISRELQITWIKPF
jgi:hypothetical protein